MHLVAFVCLSVHPSVRLSVFSLLNRLTYNLDYQTGVCLCVCNQGAYTDNSADAVNRHFNYL